jgi:hypothetical protein
MSDEKGPLYICADGFREEVETGINDREARFAALRTRIRHIQDKKLEQKRRRAPAASEPRYDEVYWDGVAALERLDRGGDDSEDAE